MEILHVEGSSLKLVPPLSNTIPMHNNVQVISPELLFTDEIYFKKVLSQLMEKVGLTIVFNPFVSIFTKTKLKPLQASSFEEAQAPLIQDELFMKTRHLQASILNMRDMNSGSICRIFSVFVTLPSASVLVNTVGML